MEKWGRLGFSLLCFLMAGYVCYSSYTGKIATENTQQPLVTQKDTIEQAEGILDDVFQKVNHSVVQISMGEAVGSGVIYALDDPEYPEQGAVVATCAHVLEYWDEFSTIRLYDTYEIPAKVIGKSEDHDVAFLLISSEQLGRQAEGLNKVSAGADVARDDFMLVTGFSESDGLTFYKGVVREPSVYMDEFSEEIMLCAAKADPGMSGGGIFDLENHVTGLMCAGSDSDLIACIPWDTVDKAYIDICLKKGQNSIE